MVAAFYVINGSSRASCLTNERKIIALLCLLGYASNSWLPNGPCNM